MFSTLRNRFGIPGVISVMALVFAMFGGAYAASDSSGGGEATASKAKAKKGPRGPRGPAGPAGPAGPTGPAGPAGPKGDAGANGASGSAGTSGKDGTSVTTTEEPPGLKCPEGGTKLVGTSTTYVCNGKKGKDGKEGSPWTAGGTLPSGATMTGVWGYWGAFPAPEGRSDYLISFPLPLTEAPETTFVDASQNEAATAPGCPGVQEGIPTADPGNLCIYAAGFSEAELYGASAGPVGGSVTVTCESECGTVGLWAVTAE
jgi:hypothetical protein